MSKGSNTTTSTQTPTALPAYQGAISQLQQVAQNPYQPYGGELVAGVNQQQNTGIGGINQNAYSAIPYLQGAESTIQGAANPLTQGQIQNYQSPYTQDVINATIANFANSNAQQQQQVLGNAAAQGALGGDRTAVAQSVLAGQQQQAEAPTIAGLENTGYGQAVNLAMQQYQQNPEQAAYGMASTGTALENAGLTGANAQVGAGTLEQQTQQAADTAAYQQFMQQQFMPESMLSWELPLLTGVGSQEGGTSTTTGPAPNPLAQYLGLGIAGVGAAGQAGGSAGIAGLAALSDKRAKENIRKIGTLNDGQHVYRFNYKGHPETRIGMLAQDVEKVNPDAVHEINGLKHVDYDEATKDAARRYFGGRVQGLQDGGSPSGFSPSGLGFSPGLPSNPWLTSSQMPRGPGAPPPPKIPGQTVQTPQQMVQNATGLATAMKKAVGDTTNNNPAFGGGNALTDSFGGSSSAPLEGLDASDYGVGYRRGGRTTPVRAGLGMASFMPRRKFDSGGGANDDDNVVNFPSDRFVQPPMPAGLYNNSAGEANPLENILKFQTYGLNSPYAPAVSSTGETPRISSSDELPPEISAGASSPSAPQAGIGTSAMSYAPQDSSVSREAPPSAAPDSVNAPPASISAMHEREAGKGLFGLSPDFYQSLMAAGLGMMASRSPFLGTAIGEGGMQGLQTYGGLKKQEQDVDLKVKQLDQAAKAEQDRIALEAKKQNFTETQMTPYEKANLGMAQQRLDQENWAPFTDPLGNPKLFNKKTGEVRDPLTANLPGTPATPGATPGTAPPSAPGVPTSQAQPGATPASASTTLPPTVDPKTGIDTKTGRNEAYLQTLNPQYQDLVKKIANYDIDPRAVGYRQKTALQAMIARYDPAYRDDIYPNIKATELAYNKGKQGDQIQFYNNSLGHMNTLLSYADAMNNGNIQVVNSLKNAVSTAFGQPAPNTFNGIKDLVAAEIMKSVVPGGGGVTEREELAKKVSAATSPQQITDLMNAYKELGGRQLYDLKLRYQAGTYGHRDDFDTRLSPEGLAEMKRVEKTEQYKGAPAAPTDPTQRHANTVYMTPKGPMMYTTRGTWTEPQI